MLSTQEIYDQAKQLPPLEKLRLTEFLLSDMAMLNPETDAVWRNEVKERWQAYQAGSLKTLSYAAVIKKYDDLEG